MCWNKTLRIPPYIEDNHTLHTLRSFKTRCNSGSLTVRPTVPRTNWRWGIRSRTQVYTVFLNTYQLSYIFSVRTFSVAALLNHFLHPLIATTLHRQTLPTTEPFAFTFNVTRSGRGIAVVAEFGWREFVGGAVSCLLLKGEKPIHHFLFEMVSLYIFLVYIITTTTATGMTTINTYRSWNFFLQKLWGNFLVTWVDRGEREEKKKKSKRDKKIALASSILLAFGRKQNCSTAKALATAFQNKNILAAICSYLWGGRVAISVARLKLDSTSCEENDFEYFIYYFICIYTC